MDSKLDELLWYIWKKQGINISGISKKNKELQNLVVRSPEFIDWFVPKGAFPSMEELRAIRKQHAKLEVEIYE